MCYRHVLQMEGWEYLSSMHSSQFYRELKIYIELSDLMFSLLDFGHAFGLSFTFCALILSLWNGNVYFVAINVESITVSLKDMVEFVRIKSRCNYLRLEEMYVDLNENDSHILIQLNICFSFGGIFRKH